MKRSLLAMGDPRSAGGVLLQDCLADLGNKVVAFHLMAELLKRAAQLFEFCRGHYLRRYQLGRLPHPPLI
jgi:hypothetical protein